MKVCFLAEYYPPNIMGGAEICAELLVDELVRKGIEVLVLTPNCRAFKDQVSRKGNLTIYRYKSIKYFTYRSKKASSKVYERSKAIFHLILNQATKVFVWEMKRKLNQVLKKHDFDVIHANNIESTLALSKTRTNILKISHVRDLGLVCLAYKIKKGKYYPKCGPEEVAEYFNTSKFMGKLLTRITDKRKKALKKINYFIAIDDFVKKNVVMEGFSEKNFVTIRDPIGKEAVCDLTKENARKKLKINFKNIVLSVGSLSKLKGAHLVPKIAKLMPDYNFLVIGQGPLQDFFEKSRLENLHYLGSVSMDALRKSFKASDVYLYPVQHASYGRTFIEALLNKLPVVSSKVEGIVHNKTGIVVQKDTPAEYAKAIKSAMENKELRKKLIKSGADFAGQTFDIKNITKQVVEFYRKILKTDNMRN